MEHKQAAEAQHDIGRELLLSSVRVALMETATDSGFKLMTREEVPNQGSRSSFGIGM
jgi:hypothetical protein